jgi:hypothetical protein
VRVEESAPNSAPMNNSKQKTARNRTEKIRCHSKWSDEMSDVYPEQERLPYI